MEFDRHLAIESSCYSLRLSFDAESFYEFDPNKAQEDQAAILIPSSSTTSTSSDFESLLLTSVSLDSSKSLLSRSYRHQSRYLYTVPSIPVALNSPRNMKDGVVSKPDNFRLCFQKFLWFVVMKMLKRMRGLKLGRKKEGKAFVKDQGCKGKRVSDANTESSINDAVLHCKISNLSSLMEEEECKA